MNKTNEGNRTRINGSVSLSGSAQFAGGDINNIILRKPESDDNIRLYESKCILNTPLTKKKLTWSEWISGIASFFSFIETIWSYIETILNKSTSVQDRTWLALFILLFSFCIFVFSFKLLGVVKSQTRHPVGINYAINGIDKKIRIERIKPYNCPKCGGKLKYYNKVVKWELKRYSDGRTRRVPSKKIPALECLRNEEHYWKVDPAEERIR